MPPRLRFAPSPTGVPHIGNLHTALFNWALARSLNGEFILRIDDTDDERNQPEAVAQIMSALNWLAIDWDEGPDIGGPYAPYYQSQRRARHLEVAQELLTAGHAYYGDDRQRQSPPPGHPLRLRLPDTSFELYDALRGSLNRDPQHLSDPVLVRSDGTPLYHLASVVDDHDMEISHVVRGEEWLSSLHIHSLIYRAMGWTEPIWVHIPLILNKQGEKLKKRDAEGGYLITHFRQAGYLAPAVWNYLMLLGWAPDNGQELVTKWDVRQQFRLERLSRSAAIFDWDKLDWLNRQYLKQLSDEAVAALIRPFLEETYGQLPIAKDWLVRVAAVIREELITLEDAIELVDWAFTDDIIYDEQSLTALSVASAGSVLTHVTAAIIQIVLLDDQTANSILQNWRQQFQTEMGLSARQVLLPIRAALTGHTRGPALSEIMAMLGKERVLRRLASALKMRQNRDGSY